MMRSKVDEPTDEATTTASTSARQPCVFCAPRQKCSDCREICGRCVGILPKVNAALAIRTREKKGKRRDADRW